jgi:hypothetical protein
MLLKICRIEKKKSLKVGNTTFFNKDVIQYFFEIRRNWPHDPGGVFLYFSIKVLSYIVKVHKTVIHVKV